MVRGPTMLAFGFGSSGGKAGKYFGIWIPPTFRVVSVVAGREVQGLPRTTTVLVMREAGAKSN